MENIKEKIKEKPYWDTSESDYYDKGYKKLLGIPGRVLQGREITSLSSYPLFILKDLLETQFKNLDIIEKINYSNVQKIIDETETLINIKNSEVLNDNVVLDLESRFNLLKTLLTTTISKHNEITDSVTYINEKVAELEEYTNNFNNNFKVELKTNLDILLDNISSYKNYIESLSELANFNNLFIGNANLNTATETTIETLEKVTQFKNNLNKITKNYLDKDKQINYKLEWEENKNTYLNAALVDILSKKNVLNENIDILDNKFTLANTAIQNNILDVPHDTLSEVIDLIQNLDVFDNMINEYKNLVDSILSSVNIYKKNLNILYISIIG